MKENKLKMYKVRFNLVNIGILHESLMKLNYPAIKPLTSFMEF